MFTKKVRHSIRKGEIESKGEKERAKIKECVKLHLLKIGPK
jgi:hypothetical protein